MNLDVSVIRYPNIIQDEETGNVYITLHDNKLISFIQNEKKKITVSCIYSRKIHNTYTTKEDILSIHGLGIYEDHNKFYLAVQFSKASLIFPLNRGEKEKFIQKYYHRKNVK